MFGKLFLFSILIAGSYGGILPDWVKYLYPPYSPWKIGTCRFNTYKEDFRPDLYFQGKWHVKAMFGNSILQADSRCSTMSSQLRGYVANVLGYMYEPTINKYVDLRGTVDLTEVEISSYNVKFDVLPGFASIKLPFTVLGTDYKNYAVVYNCQEFLGLMSEMAWIATREPGDRAFDNEIQQVLQLAKIDPSEFLEQEAMNCPANPPKL